MVEFALLAPIFFLLLLAIIEGGRFILYYQTLSSATRDGARYAIVHGSRSFCPSGPMPPDTGPSCDEPGDKVVASVQSGAFGLLGPNVEVFPTWPEGSNRRDALVKVRSVYHYAPLVNLRMDFLGNRLEFLPSFDVEAESTLVINN